MKGDHQKVVKKLTLFFLSKPDLFNGQSYQKQKGPGNSDQSLFRLENKFRKIPLLVIVSYIKQATSQNHPQPAKTTPNYPKPAKTTQTSDSFVQLFICSKILENLCD